MKMFYIKYRLYVSVCLATSLTTFYRSSCYPHTVHFQLCILNVDKIEVDLLF